MRNRLALLGLIIGLGLSFPAEARDGSKSTVNDRDFARNMADLSKTEAEMDRCDCTVDEDGNDLQAISANAAEGLSKTGLEALTKDRGK